MATQTSPNFELPFAVRSLRGGKELMVTQDELHPAQVVTKTVELKAVEPNEAANFVVSARVLRP